MNKKDDEVVYLKEKLGHLLGDMIDGRACLRDLCEDMECIQDQIVDLKDRIIVCEECDKCLDIQKKHTQKLEKADKLNSNVNSMSIKARLLYDDIVKGIDLMKNEKDDVSLEMHKRFTSCLLGFIKHEVLPL